MTVIKGKKPPRLGAGVSLQVLDRSGLKTSRRTTVVRVAIGFVSLASTIGAYTIISNLPGSNPVLMPPPQIVLVTLWERLIDLSMLEAMWASMKRVATGYIIGTGSAIIIGTLMGWFRFVEYIFDPIVEALRPIPPLA